MILANAMFKVFLSAFLIFTLAILYGFVSYAMNLESANYRLIAPSTEPINGIIESPSYAALVDSSPVNDFRADSTTYSLRGGTASNITPNVPLIECFETTTNSGTCSIGTNGMQEVCSTPGCYDRAKVKINQQQNPNDTRYALQISTTPDFSSDVKFIDGTTRLPKSSLTINDFRFKCEWEGVVLSPYCASPNITWQKYNILGLNPGTQYYIRAASLHGSSINGTFTQSEWGPSQTATTANTSLSFDIDITDDYTSGSSNAPHILSLPTVLPETVVDSKDYIVLRFSSNGLGGLVINIKGQNGSLNNGSQSIPSVSGDLDILTSGYGLRNLSVSNSSDYPTYLGSSNISATPSDFTDSGPSNKVGSLNTSFIRLLDTSGLPIYNGRSAFVAKVKAPLNVTVGNFSEVLTLIPVATF